MWEFYYSYIRPQKEVIEEVTTALQTECILRAAGCKKIKAGSMLIKWEKRGEQAYNLNYKKDFDFKDQKRVLGALRVLQKITNKRSRKK